MTKQEITAKIKEAEDTLKSLREQLEKPEGLWKPKLGERIWYIASTGMVDAMDASPNYSRQISMLKVGNYYPTKEAAQKELDKRIAIQEMREYIAEKGIGWDYGAKFYVVIGLQGPVFLWCAPDEEYQPDGLYLDAAHPCFLEDQAHNIKKYFGV